MILCNDTEGNDGNWNTEICVAERIKLVWDNGNGMGGSGLCIDNTLYPLLN